MKLSRPTVAVLAGAALTLAPSAWHFAFAADNGSVGIQIAQRGDRHGGGGGGPGKGGPPAAAPSNHGGGGGRSHAGHRSGDGGGAVRSGPRSSGHAGPGARVRSHSSDAPARSHRAPTVQHRRGHVREGAAPHHRSRSYIHRHGRRHSWAPGFTFWFYDGYYYGDCSWLRRKARETGSAYWWRRYRQCRDWD